MRGKNLICFSISVANLTISSHILMHFDLEGREI